MVVDLIKYRIWNYDHFDRKGSKNFAIRKFYPLYPRTNFL